MTLCLFPAARVGQALYKMLVIQAFRADRLLAVASQFVVAVFGEVFQHQAEAELDLGNVVSTEVRQALESVHCLHIFSLISCTLLCGT